MKLCKRSLSMALALCMTLVMSLALLPMPASAAYQGELVVPCEYYSVLGEFHEGFAPASKDGKHGFVDTTGKEFLMGVYDLTKPFTEAGVAPVGMYVRFSGMESIYRWGLIDTTGKLIVPLEYECFGSRMTSFPSGLVRWQRNGKYGLLGAGGQVVTPFQYDGMSSFRVDYAEVTINGKMGLIDANGREVVPCVYDSVYAISSYSSDGYAQEGMIHVVLNGKHGFVNTSGELMVPCKYDRVTNFSGGYAAVGISVGESSPGSIPECRWGIVNAAGQEVVPCQYESPTSGALNPPEDGLLIVRKNGKYGAINTANQLVVPYKYDAIHPLVADTRRYGRMENAVTSTPPASRSSPASMTLPRVSVTALRCCGRMASGAMLTPPAGSLSRSNITRPAVSMRAWRRQKRPRTASTPTSTPRARRSRPSNMTMRWDSGMASRGWNATANWVSPTPPDRKSFPAYMTRCLIAAGIAMETL